MATRIPFAGFSAAIEALTKPVDPDYVRMRAVDLPGVWLLAELGDDTIAPTGYPTRDTLARPTTSTPAGAQPLQMDIPLLFDRWTDKTAGGTQRSIEPELRMLDKLAGLHEGEAPVIIVEGRSVPYSYEREPALRWALTGDRTYGDVRRKANGDRVYAEVTITIVQVPEVAVLPDPKNPKRRYYTVPKSGGHRTLKAIAKALKTSTKALQKLNPKLKDPAHRLPAGTKVRIA